MITYTFYSFKGGVGRSMAMANVAEWFYRQGLRVAMIDWDLEAPGLENFFCSSKDELEKIRSRLGLIDLLITYKTLFSKLTFPANQSLSSRGSARAEENHEDSARRLHTETVFNELKQVMPPLKPLLHPIYGNQNVFESSIENPEGAALWLLPSGWRAGDPSADRFGVYAKEVQRFDWAQFYDQFEGEAFFEWLRSEFEKYADLLLIDSRTGVTEMGGVCTRQLADVVVSFCAPNRQNLEGVVGMAESFTSPKVMQARNNRSLTSVIIPSRIDDSEDKDRSEFRKLFSDRIESLAARQNLRLDARELWDLLIPYIPKYAYNERLAIGVQETNEKLVRAYEKLAAYLAWYSFQEIVLNKNLGPDLKRVFEGRLPHTPFRVPNLPEGYIERPETIDAVLDYLLQTEASYAARPGTNVTLHGLPGTGKTILATAVCHDARVRIAYRDGILWTRLGAAPNLLAEMNRLYTELMGVASPAETMSQAIDALAVALQDKVCLLVFDDVWEEEHLHPFIKAGGAQCSRVITTTNLNIAVAFKTLIINVGEMREAEAVRLIEAGLEPDADAQLASQLARQVGYLPLALAMVNSSIRGSIAYGESTTQALNSALARLNSGGLRDFEDTPFFQSVSSTISHTVSRLSSSDQKNLKELAIFAPVDIPLDLISALWGLDEASTIRVVRRISALSLMNRIKQEMPMIRLHPVVREYLLDNLEDEANVHTRLVNTFECATSTAAKEYAQHWLPYHLSKAGDTARLRSNLTNFSWLCDELVASGPASLVSSYSYLPENEETTLICDTIRLAAPNLNRMGTEQVRGLFAGQILGRLGSSQLPTVSVLVSEARQWRATTTLKPMTPSLIGPGEPLLCTLLGHTEPVAAITVLPDTNQAVSASSDGKLIVWDLETGKLIRMRTGPSYDESLTQTDRAVVPNSFSSLTSIPDGRGVITGSRDGSIRAWNIERGVEEFTLRGHTGAITSLTVSPNGTQLLSASEDRTIRVWDLTTGMLLLTLRGHTGPVTSVSITRDGSRIISGSLDRTIRIWDLSTGAQLKIFSEFKPRPSELWLQLLSVDAQSANGKSTFINSVALTPDGQIVSDSSQYDLNIWSENGRKEFALNGHTADVTSITVSADGTIVASASKDCTVRVWGLRHIEMNTLKGHSGTVTALGISSRNRIVSGGADATVRVWDWRRRHNPLGPKSHATRVTGAVFTPDGKQLLSSSFDGTVKRWDPETGDEVNSFECDQRELTALVMTGNGDRFLTGSVDHSIKVWQAATGAELYKLTDHAGPIRGLSVFPEGNAFISFADDLTIRRWDIDKKKSSVLERFPSRIGAVALSPDGKLVIHSTADGTVVVTDTQTQEVIATRETHSLVTAIAVTSNRTLVLGTYDYKVIFWPLGQNDMPQPTLDHWGAITAIAVDPSGRWAVSASDDHLLRCWDIRTSTVVASFGGDSALTACAFSPDGTIVVAGEDSGRMHFLKLDRVE